MISTKDIPSGKGGGTPKTLQPGNQTIKVNEIYLEKYPFGENSYNLMLSCEGTDLGETFEGFFIDRDNESLGRYNGQVGRVRASEWAFQDKDLENMKIERDTEILKFLQKLCNATGCTEWLEAEDGKHETIEELVAHMNEQAPYANVYMNVCLGGREYQNKGGYTNYDLFFPKFSKVGIPFEDGKTETTASQVYNYTAAEFIRVKKQPKEVNEFETQQDDFTL